MPPKVLLCFCTCILVSTHNNNLLFTSFYYIRQSIHSCHYNQYTIFFHKTKVKLIPHNSLADSSASSSFTPLVATSRSGKKQKSPVPLHKKTLPGNNNVLFISITTNIVLCANVFTKKRHLVFRTSFFPWKPIYRNSFRPLCRMSRLSYYSANYQQRPNRMFGRGRHKTWMSHQTGCVTLSNAFPE